MGRVPQPRHDRGQLCREQVARIERDHLPQFHRRAAQPRELFGHAQGIVRRQQQIGHARPLATGQPPRPFGDHAPGNAAGHLPE